MLLRTHRQEETFCSVYDSRSSNLKDSTSCLQVAELYRARRTVPPMAPARRVATRRKTCVLKAPTPKVYKIAESWKKENVGGANADDSFDKKGCRGDDAPREEASHRGGARENPVIYITTSYTCA